MFYDLLPIWNMSNSEFDDLLRSLDMTAEDIAVFEKCGADPTYYANVILNWIDKSGHDDHGRGDFIGRRIGENKKAIEDLTRRASLLDKAADRIRSKKYVSEKDHEVADKFENQAKELRTRAERVKGLVDRLESNP